MEATPTFESAPGSAWSVCRTARQRGGPQRSTQYDAHDTQVIDVEAPGPQGQPQPFRPHDRQRQSQGFRRCGEAEDREADGWEDECNSQEYFRLEDLGGPKEPHSAKDLGCSQERLADLSGSEEPDGPEDLGCSQEPDRPEEHRSAQAGGEAHDPHDHRASQADDCVEAFDHRAARRPPEGQHDGPHAHGFSEARHRSEADHGSPPEVFNGRATDDDRSSRSSSHDHRAA